MVLMATSPHLDNERDDRGLWLRGAGAIIGYGGFALGLLTIAGSFFYRVAAAEGNALADQAVIREATIGLLAGGALTLVCGLIAWRCTGGGPPDAR